MPNLLQPQGVTLALSLSTPSPTGYFALEMLEDDQVTLPNIINLLGTADNAQLTLNDGLLRTHQDAIYLNFAGGTARLHILKAPVTDVANLNKDTVITAFDLTEPGQYVIGRLNGEYALTHATSIKNNIL